MRILQVIHTFFPESAGGTEVHTYQLARNLRARHKIGILYRVFAPERPEFDLSEATYEGLPVYRLVNNFTWSPGPLFEYFCPGAEPAFLTVLDRFQPDLIHFHHLGGGLSTSFLSLATARGVPTVLTLHDFWSLCFRSHLLTSEGERCAGPEGGLRCLRCQPPPIYAPPLADSLHSLRAEIARWGWRRTIARLPGYLLARLLQPWLAERPGAGDPNLAIRAALMARDRYFRALLDLPDALLAPSRFLQRTFENWGIPGGRILHVRNGVDQEDLEHSPIPGDGRLRLVFVGSIVAQKGLDVMIEAMQRLVALPVELYIYGDDHASPEIDRYAASLRRRVQGLPVTFMGRLPHARLGAALAAADVLVLPSLVYENCPLSILEAFSARVPVIASNIGGMAELVQDGHNGLLFRVGDAGDLADKIGQLIADPGLLDRFRLGIRQPPTAAQMSHTIERIYEQVLVERRRGQRGAASQQAIAALLASKEDER